MKLSPSAIHEIGHRWINYLPGVFRPGGSHWPLGDVAYGGTLRDPVTSFGVADVIGTAGPRLPAFGQAQGRSPIDNAEVVQGLHRATVAFPRRNDTREIDSAVHGHTRSWSIRGACRLVSQ